MPCFSSRVSLECCRPTLNTFSPLSYLLWTIWPSPVGPVPSSRVQERTLWCSRAQLNKPTERTSTSQHMNIFLISFYKFCFWYKALIYYSQKAQVTFSHKHSGPAQTLKVPPKHFAEVLHKCSSLNLNIAFIFCLISHLCFPGRTMLLRQLKVY